LSFVWGECVRNTADWQVLLMSLRLKSVKSLQSIRTLNLTATSLYIMTIGLRYNTVCESITPFGSDL